MRRSLGPGTGVEREIEDAVEDDVLAVAIRGASQSAAGKLDVDVERQVVRAAEVAQLGEVEIGEAVAQACFVAFREAGCHRVAVKGWTCQGFLSQAMAASITRGSPL